MVVQAMSEQRPVVVVGAGVAGLTAAEQLAGQGVPVWLLEREHEVGGLARSFRYGDFTFDIGPHRFHTYSDRVRETLENVLGSRHVLIDRSSSVHLFERYHRWPLNVSSIFKLPPSILFRCLLNLLQPRRGRRPAPDGVDRDERDQSFEQYIVERYGQTLYDVFFKGYTTKFAHCDPSELHNTWARASIHRATIDRRYEQGSLLDVLRITLMPKPKVTKFIYPVGGIDRFAEIMKERFVGLGGRLVTDVTGLEFEIGDGRVEALRFQGQRVTPSYIVWTAPPDDLARGLELELPSLDFIHLLLFNIEIQGRVSTSNQWTYFSDPGLAISRISYPRNFHPDLVPRDKDGLCVEVTTPDDGDRFGSPGKLENRVIGELEQVGLVSRQSVERVHREFIPHAYPVYRLDYPEKLDQYIRSLAPFENLLCLGRCGTFWYNNMDDSMEAAMDLADILSGPGPGALDRPEPYPGIIWPSALNRGVKPL